MSEKFNSVLGPFQQRYFSPSNNHFRLIDLHAEQTALRREFQFETHKTDHIIKLLYNETPDQIKDQLRRQSSLDEMQSESEEDDQEN